MPELPEVETIRRSLAALAGKTVRKAALSALAPVETTTPKTLLRCMNGATLLTPQRRGKYLLLPQQAGTTLVLHLGMSGQIRIYPEGLPPPRSHRHFWLEFTDGSALELVDPRRFGTLSLSKDPDGTDNPFLARLGPDYDDPTLTEEIFIERCKRHPGLPLKALTLHQGVAAGLGNIYACEALYRSELNPKRRVGQTRPERLAALLHAARTALSLSIKHGGSSLRDYMDGLGNRGVMVDFLLVYDREGEPTLDGRGKVKRIVQQGRSTFYCPEVQR